MNCYKPTSKSHPTSISDEHNFVMSHLFSRRNTSMVSTPSCFRSKHTQKRTICLFLTIKCHFAITAKEQNAMNYHFHTPLKHSCSTWTCRLRCMVLAHIISWCLQVLCGFSCFTWIFPLNREFAVCQNQVFLVGWRRWIHFYNLRSSLHMMESYIAFHVLVLYQKKSSIECKHKHIIILLLILKSNIN